MNSPTFTSITLVQSKAGGCLSQKVRLGKWLAAQCEILIVDEPTVGLDVCTKAVFHAGRPDRDVALAGELGRHPEYEPMSQAVIRMIHT
jgi:ribose transport system ATP-binding protein